MLAAGIGWCLVANQVGQRDLWWPGLFLAAWPLISWLLLLPGATGFTATRRLSRQRVPAGGRVAVQLQVPWTGLGFGGVARVRDRLPAVLGASRWHALPATTWGPRTVGYEIEAGLRGHYQIGPTERRVSDGLGLAEWHRTTAATSSLLVTPRVEALPDLRGASGLGMATDTSLLRTGLGAADDVLIREYRQGDDVRRIHWRSTARTGELMVRREERAWDPSVTVVLDNRALGYSAQTPDERLEWAVSAAASIAVHLLAEGFDLTLVTADGRTLSPHRVSPDREVTVLAHLAELRTTEEPRFREALAAAGSGAEGQLLIAILGRVDTADIAALAEVGRHGRICWAILVGQDPEADLQQAERVRRAGWSCVVGGPDVPIARSWQDLGAGGSR